MARPEDELHPTPDRRPDVPDNAHTSDAPAGPADGPTPGPGAPPAADAGHAAAPPPSAVAPGPGGRSRRRHGPAWTVLVAGLVLLVVGIVVGHGLLIATGLVVAGTGAHLFDYPRPRPRRDQRR